MSQQKMTSAVVKHTVQERITNNIIQRKDNDVILISSSQSGAFKLAPLPAEFVPRRLGFANDYDDGEQQHEVVEDTTSSSSSRVQEQQYVPVTRRSRLPAPASFNTIKCCKKNNIAVKKTFMSLSNGEFQGQYQVKTLSDPAIAGKKKICVGLCVGTSSASDTTPTTAAQSRLQVTKTTIMIVNLIGDKEVLGKRTLRMEHYINEVYNEDFSNTLTLDEKEYLVHRVLHLFFRALASEFPVIVLMDVVNVLEEYYTNKKFFEQALDLYTIKADVSMSVPSALNSWPDIVDTLRLVGEYLEITAVVNQDHTQAGYVHEFTLRTYGSKLSFTVCATIHNNTSLAFQHGQDMNKAEEHSVAAWHTLCTGTGGDGVDINGDHATYILANMLIMYEKISESQGRASQGVAEVGQIIDIFPCLCGLLYLAGFQGRNGWRAQQSVIQLGSQAASIIFNGNLDQPSARNILIEAGARPDPNHFHQRIFQARRGDKKHIFVNLCGDSFPKKDDAKRNAKKIQKQIQKQQTPVNPGNKIIEPCNNCKVGQRSNGQPNFRCPCHKAAYCSKECQASHRKEHKKICTAVVPKKEK